MNTCGRCKWAKPIPADMRMRACMFGPPQLLATLVQTPEGTAQQIAGFRPNVSINDEAPSCFEAGIYGLDALDILADSA